MTDAATPEEAPSPERLVRYGWASELAGGGRVLDAACGAGWGTVALARTASSAVGIDFSPAAIADARERYGDRAEFREGDLRGLPFEEASFDTVVCFEAIPHVAHPASVVDELRRVLRPRGLLLISSPNRDAYPAGNPLHLNEMTSTQFGELLASRFTNVALHRQQTYLASLLCSDAEQESRDGSSQLEARTAKLAGGPPGSELHAVAVATDGELPAAPAWLALGEEVDFAGQRRLLEEWQDRAVRAEAKALALERELRAAQG